MRCDDPLESGEVRCRPQPAHEREPASADPLLVQRFELLLGESVVDICNAEIGAVRLRDGVGHDAIVATVAGGIHNHRAVDAKDAV